ACLFAGRTVGKSLYTTIVVSASRGHNFVAQFALSAGGNLAPLSPPTVATGGNQPTSIAVESSGKYAYVLDSIRDSLVTTGGADQGVSQYKIGLDSPLTFNPPSTPPRN